MINLSVTLVLAFAANTSFGGLPVLMQLLARDHRMPHCSRCGPSAPYSDTASTRWPAGRRGALIVHADTQRLLPVFAIGVFIGFTISQTGLVLHWRRERGPRWLGYALLNGTGAVITAVAGVVLFASKFIEGAWLLCPGALVDPAFRPDRTLLPSIGQPVGPGEVPAKPVRGSTPVVIVVPVVAVS